jgi:hypothetical protein
MKKIRLKKGTETKLETLKFSYSFIQALLSF